MAAGKAGGRHGGGQGVSPADKKLRAEPRDMDGECRNHERHHFSRGTTFNFPFPIEKQIIKALIILNR